MAETSSSVQEKTGSCDGNGDDFSWEAYFARTGALAVDPGAFFHVERSLRRVVSNDDGPNDEVKSKEQTIPSTVADSIQIGRYVDVQDDRDPRGVWPAEILENCGGRLLLKYACLQDAGPPFWEFYSTERVHPCGICETVVGKDLGLQYALPSTCSSPGFIPSPELLEELAKQTRSHTLDITLYQDRPAIKPHQMEVGMWLEALDPMGGSIFYPAQVVLILNKYFFVIEYDASMIDGGATSFASNDDLVRACHIESPGLLPIGSAGRQGLSFAAPENFDWALYLRTNTGRMAQDRCFQKMPADDRFIPGRRLEAVNSSAPHQICGATVIRRKENLIWLHIDSTNHLTQVHVIDCRSAQIFPCGWCAANGYPLKAPYEHNVKEFKLALSALTENTGKYTSTQDLHWTTLNNAQESAFMPEILLPGLCHWSPAIYINSHCFTGPLVDRSRLAIKPRQIGPGPMVIVLKDVAESLISSAVRPREVLSEMQSSSHPENVLMQAMEIKAKYRTKRWRGTIDICLDPQHIPEWCRQLCIRLEACPGLLSFKPHLNEKCSFDCNRPMRVKRHGLLKPLSCVAAKRLKNRISVQQKRLEDSVSKDDGEQEDSLKPTPKRKRAARGTAAASNPLKNGKRNAAYRPITRPINTGRLLRSNSKNQRPRLGSQPPRLNSVHELGLGDDEINGAESNSESSLEAAGLLRCHSFNGHSNFDAPCPSCAVETPCSNCELSINCSDETKETQFSTVHFPIPVVETNPLNWSTQDLYCWLQNTAVTVGIAEQIREELIDGQAFMLMDIYDVRNYLYLKLGPALKVCGIIKELKSVYLKRYASLAQKTKELKTECSPNDNSECNGSNGFDVGRKMNGSEK